MGDQKELREHGQVKHWRIKQGVVQLKMAQAACNADPIAVDPTYEEVLRDV